MKLGGWDSVRVSADSELLRRFRVIYGENCIKHIYPEVPLSFALMADSSLTGDPRTSLDTLYHGVRSEYLSAAMLWHKKSKKNSTILDLGKARKFPVPGFILPVQEDLLLDIALIMDARNPVRQYPLLNDIMREYPKLRIGIFHWQIFAQGSLPKLHEMHESFREGAAAGDFKIICPGEIVKTEIIIGAHVDIFKNPIDLPAEFQTNKFFIACDGEPRGAEATYAELVTKQQPILVDRSALKGQIQVIVNKILKNSNI